MSMLLSMSQSDWCDVRLFCLVARTAQWCDHLVELVKRSRPPMGQKQRNRAWARRALVNKVNSLVADHNGRVVESDRVDMVVIWGRQTKCREEAYLFSDACSFSQSNFSSQSA